MRLALIYFSFCWCVETFQVMYFLKCTIPVLLRNFFSPFLSLCVSMVLLLHGHVDLVLPLSHTSNVN